MTAGGGRVTAGGGRVISRGITIAAPPSAVFAVIADPHRHADFDGSGTVRRSVSGPERLSLGAEFRMSMKLFGVTYQITNTVKEYEENRRIAWAHPAGTAGATSLRRFRAGRGSSRPATSPPRRSAGCWRAPSGPGWTPRASRRRCRGSGRSWRTGSRATAPDEEPGYRSPTSPRRGRGRTPRPCRGSRRRPGSRAAR
ncbi:hypothetical protein NKH77_16050 [Streptomyces sp. M19]